MSEKITAMKINLLFLIRRLEELIYQEAKYEVDMKINSINQKIYEIADLIEEIEAIEEL